MCSKVCWLYLVYTYELQCATLNILKLVYRVFSPKNARGWKNDIRSWKCFLFFLDLSPYYLVLGLKFLTYGSPNAAKNNERCWNIRRVYAQLETYIWGFAGHGAHERFK